MKEWKRKIVSLLTVSMLLGSYAQTAVYAAEPEDGDVVVSDDEYGLDDPDEDIALSEDLSEDNGENTEKDDDNTVPEEEVLSVTPESDFEWDGDTITKYNGSAAEVVVPKRAVAISENSFNKNRSITTLSFENGSRCKSIMIGAFRYASNLSSVNLPESLETIASDAFYQCDLRELTIPTNVTMIGYGAFYGNSSLSKVTIESKEFELESNGGCFRGCIIGDISFPEGMTKIPAGLFSLAGLKDGTKINIPDSVTEIGEYAFNNVSNPFTIDLPASLEIIGAQAFYHSALSGSVFFPVTIKEIGTSAFNNCLGIDEVIYAGTRAQWDAMVDSKKIKSGNEPIMNPRCLGDEITWDMDKDAWGFNNWKEAEENGRIPAMPLTADDKGAFIDGALKEKYGIIDRILSKKEDESGYARIVFQYKGQPYYEHPLDGWLGNEEIINPTRTRGYCHGFATSVIANKMGYRDISDDLHDVAKDPDGQSTIACFMLMQWSAEYQDFQKKFMEEPDGKKQVEAVIEAAEAVRNEGPALLHYSQKDFGAHAVTIIGGRNTFTLDEVIADMFPAGHTYDYVVEIYDSNAMGDDGRYGYDKHGEYSPEKGNMYINTTSGEWIIPGYGLCSSELADEYTVSQNGEKIAHTDSGKEIVVKPGAYLQCVTNNPNVIYPIHYDGKEKPDSVKSDLEVVYEPVKMPDTFTVGTESAIKFTYGNWSALISRSGMENVDGRGICYYDSAYYEGMENTLPLNVYLPDVPSRETAITPAEGDSTELAVQLLVEGYYLNAAAEKVAGIDVADDGSFTVSGNNGAFEISLTSDNQPDDCFCTYTVSGNNKGDFSVSLNAEGGITVTGDNIDGMSVTASDIDGEEKVILISDEDGDGEVVIPGDKDEEKDNDDISAHSALDSQPVLNEDTTSITLVRGQKFILSDNTWKSSDKKVLAISKTKATAKKAGTVKLTHGSQTVDVTVVAPAFAAKSVKMTAGEVKSISLNNASGLDILYVSLSPDVAVVDADGTVTAISKGSAVINAYVNGAAYKYTVKVSDVDTSKRDFTKPVELKPMQSVSVKLKGFKASKAAWSSETQVSANELPKGSVFADSVVKISKSGKITAIGAGETVLTATGGSAEPVVITIRVSEPLERTMHINVNDKKPLRLYGVKGNVEWKPAEDGIVTVEKNKVKALKAGDTVLTAKVEGFTYTVTVYIEDAAVTTEGISGKKNKYTLELNAGCSAQLSFASLYQQVAFKSSDCSVAYADEDGVIHARKAGSAKLSGKISGKAVTITVKVQKYDEKAASLEEYVKSKGFTIYGYGSERYSDTEKSAHQNLPKPYKVLWHAKLPNPEFPVENLAYVRLVEIEDEMVSMDIFYSVYTGVNMLCPMEVACEVIEKLVNDPYVETTEGEGPFYYFPPYSQYIKYDFAEL